MESHCIVSRRHEEEEEEDVSIHTVQCTTYPYTQKPEKRRGKSETNRNPKVINKPKNARRGRGRGSGNQGWQRRGPTRGRKVRFKPALKCTGSKREGGREGRGAKTPYYNIPVLNYKPHVFFLP